MRGSGRQLPHSLAHRLTMGSAAATRMAKEIRMLQTDPPPGVWAAPKGDNLTELEAQVQVG